jgi:hypothetical protein
MANELISNKFICYQHETDFLADKNAEYISDKSIAFVLDKQYIYFRGKIFAGGGLDQSAVEALIPTALPDPHSLSVQQNDTSVLTFNGSAAQTLNFKDGTNVTITEDANGNIVISATDTTYTNMSADAGKTGTDTTGRLISAATLKAIIDDRGYITTSALSGYLQSGDVSVSKSGQTLTVTVGSTSESLTNTTYDTMTTAEGTTGTGTSPRVITPAVLKAIIDDRGFLTSHQSLAGYAQEANQSVSKSGQTLTVKINGTTESLTNTDTSVTSAANHYTPSKNSDSTLTASGGEVAGVGTEVQVITGIERDAKGHVTGITSAGVKNTNTVYTHPTFTAITGSPTANQSPGFGGTFTVNQVSRNTEGHVSGITERTITIPSATATTSAAGLMSSDDKTKLNGIAEGAQVNSITGVKGNAESTYRTGQVNITAANIGLGNVNNTSDANKPVSAAMKAALDLKVDKATLDIWEETTAAAINDILADPFSEVYKAIDEFKDNYYTAEDVYAAGLNDLRAMILNLQEQINKLKTT